MTDLYFDLEMKIKDLIAQLEKLPPDSWISVGWKDFDVCVMYFNYDEDIWEECWSIEHNIDHYLTHRNYYPDKVRFRLQQKHKYD